MNNEVKKLRCSTFVIQCSIFNFLPFLGSKRIKTVRAIVTQRKDGQDILLPTLLRGGTTKQPHMIGSKHTYQGLRIVGLLRSSQ